MKCPCGSEHYIKRGYYRPRSANYQPIPRYECKVCHKTFSRQTNSITHGQKRPDLNQQVLKWYASGTTLRRMAKNMGVNRKTVIAKFLWLASLARKEHERRLASGELKTNYVQFDEQHTFEHTKYKPLAVALAVRAQTGEIIEAQVATFKSTLGPKLPRKYRDEWREDTRPAAIEDCMISIKKAARDEAQLVVESDESTHYFQIIKRVLPKATYRRVEKQLPSYIPKGEQRKMRKPLFFVNLVCAKLRNDLSRMARKTWVTTKKPWALQAHLDLYIAFNNGYSLV